MSDGPHIMKVTQVQTEQEKEKEKKNQPAKFWMWQ
jgi:hypothetical protein